MQQITRRCSWQHAEDVSAEGVRATPGPVRVVVMYVAAAAELSRRNRVIGLIDCRRRPYAWRLAWRFASRIADDEITLIDDLVFESPRTKDMASILKALKIDGQTLLVAVDGYNPQRV